MKNLIVAVNNVMKEVVSIDKNSNVGAGKSSYKGTQDKDVKLAFSKAFSKNGLAIFTTKIEPTLKIERWEEEDQWSKSTPKAKKVKQSVFTEVLVTYKLVHESGESMDIQGYGHGIDSQDKGAGKATTYALKNALLYNFLTPTGDIDDTDATHSNDIKMPVKKQMNLKAG